MTRSSYYANNLNRDLNENDGLPVISQDLESIRAYQWEITFFPPAEIEVPLGFSKPLTLAAKKVNGMSVKVEDIAVNRVNDVTYYPGRPSMGELEVTFDNLLRTKAGWQLYKYFQTVYDPLTGEFASTFLDNPGQFKTTAEVLELDGQMEPVSLVKLVGLYPKEFTKAEKNYSTNDFDTVTVKFRYDFLIQLGDTRG
jgi:hypothetical protein|tara:strand:+ start:1147 stop:1737 length:591 start_codon:yes stop_codon:yes gene_type:complete